MILLPDMRFSNDNTLSIQEPHLLNGYIVTDMYIDHELSYNTDYSRVVIKNANNDCFSIYMNELERNFNMEMERFFARYGYEANVPGYAGVRLNSYNINDYLRDVRMQCDRLTRSNYRNNYLNSLRRELQRQNREWHEPAECISHTYADYYSYARSWFDDAERLYSTIGTATIDASSLRATTSSSYWNVGWNLGMDSPSTRREGYIHSHNYKPEYIHYYMPNEDKDATLLLGAEIEVDCGGKSEEHAQYVLKIMCGVDQNTGKALETKMYCMHDGSLSNGIEFATMPCSLEYHKQMPYKKMFEYLDANGYKAHDTSTCGLHIHANRTYLGKTELMQQLTISKILYILEKFNDEICVIARRDERFGKFVGNGKNETSVVELYSKYKNKDKYVALNLKHEETIEFRCFKGTLRYETYILTLEFVKCIIDYAKSINIEEVELIKWDDLMSTFPDELKAYYNNRLEKENKKKDESKKFSDLYSAEIRFDMSQPNRNLCSLSLSDYVDIRSFSYGEPAIMDQSTFRNYMLGRASTNIGDCSYSVTVVPSIEQTTERTILEELKDTEKALKKRIKYSDNPLEKKNLRKELQEVQKELKKEKRKIKLNNNI